GSVRTYLAPTMPAKRSSVETGLFMSCLYQLRARRRARLRASVLRAQLWARRGRTHQPVADRLAEPVRRDRRDRDGVRLRRVERAQMREEIRRGLHEIALGGEVEREGGALRALWLRRA